MPQETSIDDDGRLVINNLVHDDARSDFAEDVRRGLSAQPKHLFPKYFYDELGSQLFEAICLLPEYYPTRAENEILTRYADEIAASVDGDKTLLEMGSGSASKTRLIIEALLRKQTDLHFIPVDISASALETSSRVLLQSYPRLRITAYASDYFSGLAELQRDKNRTRTLALFLGSNIGNFDAEEAHRFLRALRGVLNPGDALLLGADLKKGRDALEAAYDDALGVTAAFNLNLLSRINRELDADFNPRAFKHHVRYNTEAGRVEVYIESRREQTVALRKLDMEVHFQAGERIHTENSYKYDLTDLSALAIATGFERTRTWLDEREQFSSNLFMAA
jgi:L-histidine N-alpha-methyltransferase